MGKTTGFLEYTRELPAAPSARRAHQRLVRNLPRLSRRKDPRARRALHGLRRAVLPHRLPAHQHHSRLERPGLPRPLARSHPRAARHQQLPRVHRPHLSRALRSRLRAGHQRAAGHHQADREDHRRPRLRRRLDRARAARDTHRQARRRRRLRSRRPGRRAAIARAPDMPSPSSKRPTASAACCATASPTSRWRSISSTGAWSRCAPRASSSSPTPMSA